MPVAASPPPVQGWAFLYADDDDRCEYIGNYRNGSRQPDCWDVRITDDVPTADRWADLLAAGLNPGAE